MALKKNFQFLVWTDQNSPDLKIPSFQTVFFKNGKKALKSEFQENSLLQIKSPFGPGDWVEEAGKLCLKQSLSALVTGPVSKAVMKKNKYKALSQTDLLRKLCKKNHLFMCFRGSFFNLILFTDHIPLKKISIERKFFKKFLRQALKSRVFLKSSLQKKPLGVLGLNSSCRGEGFDWKGRRANF